MKKFRIRKEIHQDGTCTCYPEVLGKCGENDYWYSCKNLRRDLKLMYLGIFFEHVKISYSSMKDAKQAIKNYKKQNKMLHQKDVIETKIYNLE